MDLLDVQVMHFVLKDNLAESERANLSEVRTFFTFFSCLLTLLICGLLLTLWSGTGN